MIKHRIKKLEDKKYFKNSEERELKEFGAETKALVIKFGLDPDNFNFDDWVGTLYAFGTLISRSKEVNAISKEEFYKRKGIEP